MTRPGYRTQAQKEGRSAGQRKRRQARERKRRMRERNVYQISVRKSVLDKARTSNEDLAVYGVHKDGGEWVLTAMAVRRSEEKLVSDRQGATRSEVRSRAVVTPSRGELDPSDGLALGTFDTKSVAMDEISAESSTRIDTGKYVVRAGQWKRSMDLHEVDRDKYRDFLGSHETRRIRD